MDRKGGRGAHRIEHGLAKQLCFDVTFLEHPRYFAPGLRFRRLRYLSTYLLTQLKKNYWSLIRVLAILKFCLSVVYERAVCDVIFTV